MAVDATRLAPYAQHPSGTGWAFSSPGGTAFAVDALVLQLLTAVLGLHPIPARLAAISLALIAGWLMHRTSHIRGADAAERARVLTLHWRRLGG